MLFTISAKIIGSFWALLLFVLYPAQILLVAAVLGIAPIWLELLACYFTKVEPGAEQRFAWKVIDNCVDLICFVVLPASFYSFFINENLFHALCLLIFCVAAVFRILRFLQTGLLDNKYFIGLPVTYTGYVWIVLAVLNQWKINWLPGILLLFLAYAMITKRIKIKSI